MVKNFFLFDQSIAQFKIKEEPNRFNWFLLDFWLLIKRSLLALRPIIKAFLLLLFYLCDENKVETSECSSFIEHGCDEEKLCGRTYVFKIQFVAHFYVCAGLSFWGEFCRRLGRRFWRFEPGFEFQSCCRWLFKILIDPKRVLCYAKTFQLKFSWTDAVSWFQQNRQVKGFKF